MISTYTMFQTPFGSGTSFMLATNSKNFRIIKTMSDSLAQLSGDQNCLTYILPRKNSRSKRLFCLQTQKSEKTSETLHSCVRLSLVLKSYNHNNHFAFSSPQKTATKKSPSTSSWTPSHPKPKDTSDYTR